MTSAIPLAPTEFSVECCDEPHRLRWADGTLTALDHDDLDGERTLAALGGEPATCIGIVDAWARYESDLAVLVSASRGPHDPVEASLRPASRHHISFNRGPRPRRPRPNGGWAMYMPMRGSRPQSDEDDFDLSALLSMGGALPGRLVATVISNWSARLDRGEDVSDAMPALHAALRSRAVPLVLGWLGDPTREITFAMSAPGTTPTVHTDEDEIRVEFPFAWLLDVWAPALGIVLDDLCLTASRAEDGRWALTTLDRDLVTTYTVTIERADPRDQ